MEVLIANNPPTEKEAKQVFEYLGRKAKPRFYADENFPADAVALLRDMGAQVRTVQDVRLNTHPDENHAAFALKNGLVLLTCDRDYLNDRRFPLVHCPAIFVFDFGSGSIQEMKLAFRCLEAVFRAPQFYDKWWKVDAKRDCWTESVRYQNGSTSRGRFRVSEGKLQQWAGELEG